MELKLKPPENPPTLWQKLLRWLHGADQQLDSSLLQVPKTGTNTEILLTNSKKDELQRAIDAPMERSSDTTTFFRRKSDGGQDDAPMIL